MIKDAAIRGLSALSVSCARGEPHQRSLSPCFFLVAPTQKTIPLLNVGLKLALEAPAKRQVRGKEVTEDPRNWLPTRHKGGWRAKRGIAWEENWMSKKLGESEKLYIHTTSDGKTREPKKKRKGGGTEKMEWNKRMEATEQEKEIKRIRETWGGSRCAHHSIVNFFLSNSPRLPVQLNGAVRHKQQYVQAVPKYSTHSSRMYLGLCFVQWTSPAAGQENWILMNTNTAERW